VASKTLVLDEASAKELLRRWHVPVPRGTVCDSAAAARQAAEKLRRPLAVKALRAGIIHKAAEQAVYLNVRTAEEAEGRGSELLARFGGTILVEEQQAPGQEVFLSVVRDDEFGYVLLLADGGRFAEQSRFCVSSLVPVTRPEVEGMLAELPIGSRLLTEHTQKPGDGIAALVDIVVRIAGVGGLVETARLDQLELNPVIVTSDRAVVVDAVAIEGSADVPGARDTHASFDFDTLFFPRAAAVIGASERRVTWGNNYLRKFSEWKFGGDLYAIHPSATEIDGVPCVKHVSDIAGGVDLIIVAVPAARTAESFEGAQLRAVTVLTAGFSESGPAGAALEANIVAAVRAAGGRLIGPNCLGVHCPEGGYSFLSVSDVKRRKGGAVVFSQSGGVTADILQIASHRGLGVAKAVSVGNCADISVPELIAYAAGLPDITCFGVYLETSAGARRLAENIKESGLPAVLLKGGVTQQGNRTAQSHTAALAGDSQLWHGLARSSGLIMVEDLPELVSVLSYMDAYTATRLDASGGALVFGPGGGVSVLAADMFGKHNVDLPEIEDEVRRDLEALDVPPGTSFRNPIDTSTASLSVDTPSGDMVTTVVSTVLRKQSFADVILHLNVPSFVSTTGIGKACQLVTAVAGLAQSWNSVRFGLVLRGEPGPRDNPGFEQLWEIAAEHRLPAFSSLSEAAIAVEAIQRYQLWRSYRDPGSI
jgi:acyl-CoA synthetase (NDP forming)